ncbi:uncharacterized protein LOC144784162 [Lissotriton helveticus]
MGKTREYHDSKVKQVLEILDNKGLTAEHEKCKFACKSVSYLGHEITGEGISPKKELLNAIEDSPVPSNRNKVRSFLGLSEFYAKFIMNVSSKTHELRQLLKMKNKFEWTEVCQQAFITLKKELCTALPLQGFDPLMENIVTTDRKHFQS